MTILHLRTSNLPSYFSKKVIKLKMNNIQTLYTIIWPHFPRSVLLTKYSAMVSTLQLKSNPRFKFQLFLLFDMFSSILIHSYMKRSVFLFLMVLLAAAQTDTLQLYTVSNTLAQVVQPTGSTLGGTTIYIRGLGFNANAANNQVFVGPYPCIIPADGATETTIACITSSTGQNSNIYGLPIIVISNGQQKSLTNEQGSFSYLSGQTPTVLALYPASAVPGTFVKFYGVHRISALGDGLRDMGDVRSMLIGNSICGRFDIIEGPINANSPDTISCNMAGQQQAGKYQVSQYLVPGYSIPAYLLQRTSFIQEKYHFAVLPGVKSVSPNSGSIAGQQLTIAGSGFSTNSSVVQVTVNGTVCDVASSSLTQIVCNLRPQDNTANSKLTTNSNSQTNGYFSGAGLSYSRYDISKLTAQNVAGLRNAIQINSSQITLQETGYRGDLKSGNYYGSYYGQAFTGYFTAPVDGVYTFQGVADDVFALYISSSYGSTDPAAAPLIYSNSCQNQVFYIGYTASAQGSVTLQAGKSYYIEAYHINGAGAGFFDISVQIPNTDTSLTWQTHAVHTLQLNFTNDPEVVVFNQTGGTGGQLNLTVTTKVVGAPPIVQYAVVNYNATISQFLAALNQLSCFGPYQISGQQVLYDSTGAVTANISQVYTYSWAISIWLVRNSASSAAKIIPYYLNYNGTKSFVQATVHPHGPLIGGTFGLVLNGAPVTYSGSSAIPATISASALQACINAMPGFQNTIVYLTSSSSYQSYGSTWLILFYGVNGLLPPILTDSINLVGGVAGTQPAIYSNIIRNYSPNLLLDPVDFNLLNTPSPTTNVLVTVNNLPSVCIGACSYTFVANAPLLTSATISNSLVTLSLTDPALIGFTLADTTVTIAGQPCTIVNPSSSISNFQCQLPANPNGTPTIPAGSYTPVVTVTQVGIVARAPAVVPFNFPLTLASLNVTSGGTNGGFGLHLVGTGFPTTLVPGTTVSICGVSATITAISNTDAYIIMPPCALGQQSISLSAGSLTTNTLPFTYTAPPSLGSIFTVTPQSYNPALKGIMQITGTGFGTDASSVRVDLANATGKVYHMRILVLNNTYIKVGIPGGLAGHYKVQVNLIGSGQIMPANSTCNDFTYELVINSVSPSSGSYNGGTLIHLQGINFDTALDQTLVFVGNEINWFCTVETLNQTDLTCRTPPASSDYNISLPQTVYLENRLMADNTCGAAGACTFNYIPKASSPQLTAISATVIASGSVVLSGYNLNLYTPQVVLTNAATGVTTFVTPASATATSLNFTLPNVQSGTYTVKARLDPLGESNGLLLNITTALASTAPLTLSTNGGRVVLSGTGFPATWPNSAFILTITSNGNLIAPSIFANTPAALTLLLPASTAAFKITLTSPVGNTITAWVTPAAAATPVLTLTSATPKTAGPNTLTFSKANLQTAVPTYVEVYSLFNNNELYNVTIPTQTVSTSLQFTVTLPGGIFGFRFFYPSYGYATANDNISVTIPQPTIPASLISSYNGASFTLTGTGLSPSATLKVNGFTSTLSNITASNAIASIPAFVSVLTQTQYDLVSPYKLTRSQFAIISDTPATNTNPFDGRPGTVYTSSSSSDCFLGIDVGSQLTLNLTRVRFFPNSNWIIAANYLVGATIQASNDNTNYDIIAYIDSTVHTGWNILPTTLTKTYRYFKFAHNIVSQCQLAELEFTGILFSNNNVQTLTSNSADIVYNDGANTFTYAQAVQFRQDGTPVVNSLSKTTGDVFGGYPLTLTGNYLNFSAPTVTIDGQICAVTTSSTTAITCTVAPRLTLPSHNSFTVSVGNSLAVINQVFSYVLRWSDIRTWGTDMPPIDGDLVYVPKGMNLLVDQSTPNLKGILVENGTLTFADESDMVISAGFIAVDGGSFVAGTQDHPYQHQLTFVMYGSYYGSQLPMFGNKGIGCMQCSISLHGQVRNYPWTSLANTATIGANTITVQDPVDWKVGEEIVIASTSFDHYEAERRTITAVSGTTVTLNASLIHQHFAGVENYGTDKVEMRAEVALLTRNIKVTGDPTSQQNNYGAHLMMAGSAENGLVANIAYTEFFNCGQPRIIGRYCIHFHMNGDVSDSYVRGNAVHDSMARVVTLHGVHFLTVEHNVGYNVKGHNFFVQDGIETFNLIQYNLAISSIQVWTMLQTDISVASFWITHPTNNFRYNHAAGSDFYGVWYEIKPNPDGPSATSDVCPMGNALGESHHNVAHSNVRFGLRIFKLSPRTYPCSPIFTTDLVDPWASNPPVTSTFYTFTLYKNGECGLLAEQTGNLVFSNFTSVQNKRAGAEFYVTEFTQEPVQFINSVIVGQTLTNLPQDVTGAKGIITPRLGNIKIDNVRFYNYPPNTHSLQTCSNCDHPLLYTNTAQEVYISNISYHNVSGNKLFMNGLKRQILYDLDGTFTTTAFDGTQRASAAITNNYPHLLAESACVPTSNTSAWDNTIACDQTVKVARVTFNHVQSSTDLRFGDLKAQLIPSITYQVPQNSTSYTHIYSFSNPMDSMNLPMTWALPYVTGRTYNIWWWTGPDFDSLQMFSSNYLTDNDPAILFKFNYTLHRQLFDIGAVRPDQPLTNASLFSPTPAYLDAANCANGNYFFDDSVGQRTLQICASAASRTYFQTTSITAVPCRYLCPAPPGEFVKESFVRYWSNQSQWPGERMPLPGENVTVNGNWTIIMDVDPAPCGFMQIDGEVIIEDKEDRNVTCQGMWIRAGSITAGSSTIPFTHKLTFQINGLKDDGGWTFDPALQGNKIFVVTGVLALYGSFPASVQAKLTASAFAGDTTITVDNASGWAVGDTLVITPSFSASTEYQRVTITAINGNSLSINPALQFTHYGSNSVTISNSVGQLDTRTSVGHVNRNIRFVSGPDNGWGYSVVVYQMWDDKLARAGKAILSGVEFTLGGQYGSEAATLNLMNNGDTSAGTTVVQYSSFSNCRTYCLYAQSHTNANLTNNVFFEGSNFHLKLSAINNFYVSSNLMVAAIFPPNVPVASPTACLELTNTDPIANNNQIINNVCQGSKLNGYVFPFLPCGQIANNPFFNNLVGSAEGNGFLLTRVTTDGCLAFSGVRAFACTVGQIANPPGTTQLQYTSYILADNKRSLSLRFGLAGNDRTAIVSNSYFTQISRPTCTQCYVNGKTSCRGHQAIRLPAITVNGQSYPMSFGTGYDGLCREEVLDSKAYFYNVVFDHYRTTYTEPALSACANNVIFRANPGGMDLVGSAYLTNTSCTNCDFSATAYFDAPNPSELGWFGGCGLILCTGRNNYIIQDQTGTLFPSSGVLLANNSWIGDNVANCTVNSVMNGYYCTRHDFAVLEYESIAPDYNKRIMWPVALSYAGGNWSTQTNGYREWDWVGSEPQNRRLGRFISTLQLFQYYNMSFASNPPDDMHLQIQKRVQGGNNADWVVVTIYYPFPNAIAVLVNDLTIKPISLLDSNSQSGVDVAKCGSNVFYFRNYTIQFVVTGDVNCLVRVTLTNSVQLTLHFAMNINDFWNVNGPTRLVDRVCAVLGISDQSQVKIVGIYSGSVEATVVVSAPTTPANESTTVDPAQGLVTAQGYYDTLNSALVSGSLNSALMSGGVGPLIDSSLLLMPMSPATSKSSSSESNSTTAILIGVFVSIGVVVLVAILVIIYIKKRNSRKVADLVPQITEDGNSVDLKQNNEIQHDTEENVSEFIIEGKH